MKGEPPLRAKTEPRTHKITFDMMNHLLYIVTSARMGQSDGRGMADESLPEGVVSLL